MSDDDEGDDYGDYEELGPGNELQDDNESLTETGLDKTNTQDEVDEVNDVNEDGAGTDDDEDDEAVLDTEESSDIIESTTQKARPERQKIDPVLRESNKSQIVRIVKPDDRVTDNRLHKSEAALAIAMRAQQIAKYGTHFIDGGIIHDPVELAHKEFLSRRSPFILRRIIGYGPNGESIVEEWPIREMTLPSLEMHNDTSN